MVYTYYMVYVTCVLIEQLVPTRPPKKLKDSAKGLILHLKGPRLPKWFLEAALQLKNTKNIFVAE